MLEAEEQRTVSADRKVDLKANDYLQVARSSHTRVGQTVVVEAGQQVHLKAGAQLILDAGASITLKGGGQHIVIGPGGIFSSTEIQIGGAPAVGTAAAPVLPGIAVAALTKIVNTIPMEALLKQNAVFREATSGICPVCDAAQGQLDAEGAQA